MVMINHRMVTINHRMVIMNHRMVVINHRMAMIFHRLLVIPRAFAIGEAALRSQIQAAGFPSPSQILQHLGEGSLGGWDDFTRNFGI